MEGTNNLGVQIGVLLQGLGPAIKGLESLIATTKKVASVEEALSASSNKAAVSFNNLAKAEVNLTTATFRTIGAFKEQLATLEAISVGANKAAASIAASMMTLRQGTSTFYTAFSGNVKQNLASLYRNSLAAKTTIKELRSEMDNLVTTSKDGLAGLSRVADNNAMRFRLMGRAHIEVLDKVAMNMVTRGKQMQWVGRQMMVGITAPFAALSYIFGKAAIDLNRAQTEVQKFLSDTRAGAADLAMRIRGELTPAIQGMSRELGLGQVELMQMAADWAATGQQLDGDLVTLTKLTAQLQTLTQGEVDAAQAMELVRSVYATWGRDIEYTTDQIKQLQLINSITALQMNDIVESLPLVASTAQSFNITAAETAALLAGMREQGVASTQAAHALKKFFSDLVKPTKDAKESLEDVGINLQELLYLPSGESRNGIESIRALAESVQGLTDRQRDFIITSLVGARQGDRIRKLFSAITDEGSNLNKALVEITNQTKADVFWQEQLDTVLGSVAKKWDIFKVKIEIAAAKLGEVLLPRLEGLAEALIGVMDGFARMPQSAQKFIFAVAGITAAIGPALYLLAQLQLVAGNVLKVPAAIGRGIFGVKGVEAPGIIRELGRSATGGALAGTAEGQIFQILAGIDDGTNMGAQATQRVAEEASEISNKTSAAANTFDAGTTKVVAAISAMGKTLSAQLATMTGILQEIAACICGTLAEVDRRTGAPGVPGKAARTVDKEATTAAKRAANAVKEEKILAKMAGPAGVLFTGAAGRALPTFSREMDELELGARPAGALWGNPRIIPPLPGQIGKARTIITPLEEMKNLGSRLHYSGKDPLTGLMVPGLHQTSWTNIDPVTGVDKNLSKSLKRLDSVIKNAAKKGDNTLLTWITAGILDNMTAGQILDSMEDAIPGESRMDDALKNLAGMLAYSRLTPKKGLLGVPQRGRGGSASPGIGLARAGKAEELAQIMAKRMAMEYGMTSNQIIDQALALAATDPLLYSQIGRKNLPGQFYSAPTLTTFGGSPELISRYGEPGRRSAAPWMAAQTKDDWRSPGSGPIFRVDRPPMRSSRATTTPLGAIAALGASEAGARKLLDEYSKEFIKEFEVEVDKGTIKKTKPAKKITQAISEKIDEAVLAASTVPPKRRPKLSKALQNWPFGLTDSGFPKAVVSAKPADTAAERAIQRAERAALNKQRRSLINRLLKDESGALSLATLFPFLAKGRHAPGNIPSPEFWGLRPGERATPHIAGPGGITPGRVAPAAAAAIPSTTTAAHLVGTGARAIPLPSVRKPGFEGSRIPLVRGYEKWFGSYERAVISSRDAMGSFTTVLLRLTSILPGLFLALTAGAAAVVNWKSIWEGMKEPVFEAGKIIGDTFDEIIKSFVETFTGKGVKDGSQAWVEFGRILGNVVKVAAEGLRVALIGLGGVIRFLIQTGTVMVKTFAGFAKIFTDPVQAIKDLIGAGKGINVVTATIARLATVFGGLLVIDRLSKMFRNFKNNLTGLVPVFQAQRAAMSQNIAGLDIMLSKEQMLAVRRREITAQQAVGNAIIQAKSAAMMRDAGVVAISATAEEKLAYQVRARNWALQQGLITQNNAAVGMTAATGATRTLTAAMATLGTVMRVAFGIFSIALAAFSIFQMFNQKAEAAVSVAKRVKESFEGIRQAAEAAAEATGGFGTNLKTNTQAIESYLDSLKEAVTTNINDEELNPIGTVNMSKIKEQEELIGHLKDQMEEARDEQRALEAESGGAKQSDRYKQLNTIIADIEKTIAKVQGRINTTMESRRQLFKEMENFAMSMVGASEEEIANTIKLMEVEIRLLRVRALSAGTGTALRETLFEQLAAIEAQIRYLESPEFKQGQQIAYYLELANQLDADAEAADAGEAAGDEFAKEFNEAVKDNLPGAIENQLGQLTDQVVNAVLEQFDKMAEAKVGAIDKQIEAINEQNEKEEWLLAQQEYRQQKEELLRQRDLNAAISYRERLKAIHEGRFDDARLIALQALDDQQQSDQDIADLDKDWAGQVEDHADEMRIKTLESQKETLQTQLDQQRTLLENMLNDLTEFGARNKDEWNAQYAAIQKLAEQNGIKMNDVANDYLLDYGRTIAAGLAKAYKDAEQEATRAAQGLASGVGDAHTKALNEGMKSPAMDNYHNLVIQFARWFEANPNAPMGEVVGWMERIMAARTGDIAGTSGGGSYIAPHVTQQKQLLYHSGGMIRAYSPGADVPITAQEGEYVIKRPVVQRLGKEVFDAINNGPLFHDGGYVDTMTNYLSGTAVNKTMGSISGIGIGSIMGKALGNIGDRMLDMAADRVLGAATAAGPRVESMYGKVTPAALKWINAIKAMFPAINWIGAESIRKIAGTNTWSQHAYGNAVDVSAPWETMQRIWDFGIGNASAYAIRNQIFNRQIWSEGGGVRGYGGVNPHTDHVHDDFNPPWTGDPYSGGMPVGGFGGLAGLLAGTIPAAPTNIGAIVALGKSMAALRGWTGANWDALYALWQAESGWNPFADNLTSSAFGIPQAMTSIHDVGAAYLAGDPAAQIAWGLDYIAGRYGTPSAAYAAFLSRDPHWYHGGGMVKLPAFGTGGLVKSPTIAMLGERGPEWVVPDRAPVGTSGLGSNSLAGSISQLAESFSNHLENGEGGIIVNFDGNFFGDDQSLRKLAQTLEEVNRKVSRSRGQSSVKINVGGF